MKPQLLLLTNSYNTRSDEDLFLANYLKDFFCVTVAHPLEAIQYEDDAAIILVRNIWPTAEIRPTLQKIFERIQKKNIPLYNPLGGAGDMSSGKRYLATLWQQGYPVIPTILQLSEIFKLPPCDFYIAKPLLGESSRGVQKISKEKILNYDISNKIIQPFIDFKYELSFYFLDGVFQHALVSGGPKKRWYMKQYEPTSAECVIAQQFIDWNHLPYGLQRIDFGATMQDKMLLMEIEDWCPQLSLSDMDKTARDSFLRNLVQSLRNLIGT